MRNVSVSRVHRLSLFFFLNSFLDSVKIVKNAISIFSKKMRFLSYFSISTLHEPSEFPQYQSFPFPCLTASVSCFAFTGSCVTRE